MGYEGVWLIRAMGYERVDCSSISQINNLFLYFLLYKVGTSPKEMEVRVYQYKASIRSPASARGCNLNVMVVSSIIFEWISPCTCFLRLPSEKSDRHCWSMPGTGSLTFLVTDHTLQAVWYGFLLFILWFLLHSFFLDYPSSYPFLHANSLFIIFSLPLYSLPFIYCLTVQLTLSRSIAPDRE